MLVKCSLLEPKCPFLFNFTYVLTTSRGFVHVAAKAPAAAPPMKLLTRPNFSS